MSTISEEYRKLNQQLHEERDDYGAGGAKHGPFISSILEPLGIRNALDYGCGKHTLARWLAARGGLLMYGYDPAVPAYAFDPQPYGPFDLVTCTDVLEHVEPDRLQATLSHIRQCTGKFIYLEIATRPDSSKTLPDGTNPHKIIKDSDWWAHTFCSAWLDACSYVVLEYTPNHSIKLLVSFSGDEDINQKVENLKWVSQ
jgi:hypothetical protein